MDSMIEGQQSSNAVAAARSGRLRRWAVVLVVAVVGSALAAVAPGAKAVQGELVERVGHIDDIGTEVVSSESPDGTRLYVGTDQGQVDVYERSGSTWASVGLATVSDFRAPVNDIVATNTHFYVAVQEGVRAYSRELGPGFTPIRTGCVTGSPAPGCATVKYQIGHVYSLALDAAGSTLYAGGSYAVTALHAGPGGTLAFSDCVMATRARVDPCTGVNGLVVVQGLALNGTGRALFAGAENALVVLRPPIHTGGRFQFVQCFGNRKSSSDPFAAGPSECAPTPGLSGVSDIAVGAVDPLGQFDPVYVTAYGSDALSQYYFDRSTGRLGFYECHRDVQDPLNGCAHGATFIASPSSIAMSPDRRFAYVTGRDSFSLTPFFPEPGQPWGALVQHGCLADVAQDASGCIKQVGLVLPGDVSISPAGSFVYVAADVLSIFRLDTTRSASSALGGQLPVPSDTGQSEPGPDASGPDAGEDLTAPETTIDSAPKPKTRKSDATFTFSSSEESTFECSFDGDDFDACSSPHAVTNIAKGQHSFQVVAVDAAGNRDQTPARVDFKIKTKRR
jgi:hypothetical protein